MSRIKIFLVKLSFFSFPQNYWVMKADFFKLSGDQWLGPPKFEKIFCFQNKIYMRERKSRHKWAQGFFRKISFSCIIKYLCGGNSTRNRYFIFFIIKIHGTLGKLSLFRMIIMAPYSAFINSDKCINTKVLFYIFILIL